MGQESSHLIDPGTPTETLSDRSLRAVAQFIKDGHAKNIVAMTGAGISTAAGIPDFRSPKTGLYHNLSRFNLPHPEAVFEIDFFRSNPEPFYLLAKELYPGNFGPTICHVFISLLAKKGLLRMLFTQNIDCLEREAGVPGDKIIEAHGSFATQRCIDCRTEFPDDKMREYVQRGEPPHCVREGCGGLVKPDIVFFGEQLPERFYRNIDIAQTADLVLVMGTSLLVHPFAGLPRQAGEGVPRVLFNLEQAGDLGSRADDVLCLDECDSGVRKLADELGWRDELEAAWRSIVGDKEADRQLSKARKEETIKDGLDDVFDDLLEELVEDVDNKLDISASPGTNQDAEPEANVTKQEGGGAASPADAPAAVPASSHEKQLRVEDGLAVPSETTEESRKEGEKKPQDDSNNSNIEKSPLSYEPVKPMAEKPITAEDNKGGGEKLAL